MSKIDTALSDKQCRFVAEYLVDSNGARAAVAAGYGVAGSRVAACRLLANANVQNALQARQSADATSLSIQRSDAIQGLLEAVAMAKEAGNPGAMISGWSAIGKMLGFYAPALVQVDVSKRDDRELSRMQRMSDSELAAIISSS